MSGLPWGGSEALWHAVAMHALAQGDEVFVSVYDWGKPHPKVILLGEKGAAIHYRKRYNAEAGTVEKVKRFIKKRKPSLDKDYQSIIDFKPSVVFISQGDSFDLAIHHRPLYELLLEHKVSYSFICHSHEQFSWIPPEVIYPGAVEIFNNAKQVFFISHRQWKIIERRLATKITNGHFTWNPLNIQLPGSPLDWPMDDIIQFAMVSNINGNKGHDTILEVLSQQQWKTRKWVLNMYGDGEGRKYVEDLALFYGIKNLRFHGYMEDITKVWHHSHILLIPSAGEGLPISLAEAMACGRPAIVTDVGGNTELITAGETGFVAAAPSTHSFSEAMETAWKAKESWRYIGVIAFKKVNKLVDKEPHVKVYGLLKNDTD